MVILLPNIWVISKIVNAFVLSMPYLSPCFFAHQQQFVYDIFYMGKIALLCARAYHGQRLLVCINSARSVACLPVAIARVPYTL